MPSLEIMSVLDLNSTLDQLDVFEDSVEQAYIMALKEYQENIT